MRKRFIWDRTRGELVPAEEYERPVEVHHVMPDIKPYKSMIDGSIITSRSKHRSHLKSHGCIEIGNEVKHMKKYGEYKSPPGLKETIIRAFNEKVR